MKILIFSWRCWLNPDAGGAEIFTKEVARRWARAGNDVTLFTAEFDGCKRDEVDCGVRIVRSGRRYSVYGRAKEYYKRVLSKEGYDIVIDEINTRPFLTPKFVSNGDNIVALIHQLAREYWFYETPFPMSYIGYYFLEKRWLKNYVDIPTVTVSESTRQDLADLGFKKVFVVPEGLNFEPLDKVPEKEDYPVVAYVGRLKRAKRPDHAVKAFSVVREKIPQAELWIVGDGYFIRDLEKMAGEGVRFFSGSDDSKRRELISRAWVLVNPSIREGWGLNVIEANALGTPGVSYDVPGLRESILDGKTGLVTRLNTPEELAKNIAHILQNDTLRGELASNSLEYSRIFSWDRTAAEIMEILEEKI
jgi:glycosyltransferase involved in cell wall biosynthesis